MGSHTAHAEDRRERNDTQCRERKKEGTSMRASVKACIYAYALCLLSVACNALEVPPLCGRLVLEGQKLDLPDDWMLTTRVILNNGQAKQIPSPEGIFCFQGLAMERGYMVTVASPDYIFVPMYVECHMDTLRWSGARVTSYSGPLPNIPPSGGNAIELFPLEKLTVFEEKPKFNPLMMFANPMLLMSLISVGLMYLLPKLTEGLSEEEKKEMAAANPMSGGNMDFASMLSTLTAPPPADNTNSKKEIEKKKPY